MSVTARHTRLADPEDFLAELTELFAGLDETQSLALAARVILLLSNEIGDRETLREAFAMARAVD